MVQLLDSGERRLGVSLMVSILIHGLLLFAYPHLRSLGIFGTPEGKMDGVIQVIRVETPESPTNQHSKIVTKQVQPAAAPQKEPKEPAAPKVEVEAEEKKAIEPQPAQPKTQEAKVVDKSQPSTRQKTEENPKPVKEEAEPQKAAEPKPSPAQNQAKTNEGLLTSEKGQEVALAEEPVQSAAPEQTETQQNEEPTEEPSQTKETLTETDTPSEQSDITSSSETISGTESEGEPAPPPLPPLPGTNSIFPRTEVPYPKGAQNEDAGGTWIGAVMFPTGNRAPIVLDVIQATGNSSLDQFAARLVERGLQYPDSGVDYVATVEITFTGSPDYAVMVHIEKIDYAE